MLLGVNGTWFIWVVGTQSIAVAIAALDRPGTGLVRAAALSAVALWSVGAVPYVIVAALVLTRLLLREVRPQELTPPGCHGRDLDHRVRRGADPGDAAAPALTVARSVLLGLGLLL